jgi:hypothetical protein
MPIRIIAVINQHIGYLKEVKLQMVKEKVIYIFHTEIQN